ncbi:hypothetical protein BROUX41_002923 [Berkeleyomyces rouxiae]|uniref:uncharacterized protein n=1 Tax=Berkeleyomyces rouxiae TaxID=2035830 RepID=UPI003B7E5DD1
MGRKKDSDDGLAYGDAYDGVENKIFEQALHNIEEKLEDFLLRDRSKTRKSTAGDVEDSRPGDRSPSVVDFRDRAPRDRYPVDRAPRDQDGPVSRRSPSPNYRRGSISQHEDQRRHSLSRPHSRSPERYRRGRSDSRSPPPMMNFQDRPVSRSPERIRQYQDNGDIIRRPSRPPSSGGLRDRAPSRSPSPGRFRNPGSTSRRNSRSPARDGDPYRSETIFSDDARLRMHSPPRTSTYYPSRIDAAHSRSPSPHQRYSIRPSSPRHRSSSAYRHPAPSPPLSPQLSHASVHQSPTRSSYRPYDSKSRYRPTDSLDGSPPPLMRRRSSFDSYDDHNRLGIGSRRTYDRDRTEERERRRYEKAPYLAPALHPEDYHTKFKAPSVVFFDDKPTRTKPDFLDQGPPEVDGEMALHSSRRRRYSSPGRRFDYPASEHNEYSSHEDRGRYSSRERISHFDGYSEHDHNSHADDVRHQMSRFSREDRHSRRDSSLDSPSRESRISKRKEVLKRGTTKMPFKYVEEDIIQDKGYPYHIKGHSFIIEYALQQHQIDELLRLTEDYRKPLEKQTYIRESASRRRNKNSNTDVIEHSTQERIQEDVEFHADLEPRRRSVSRRRSISKRPSPPSSPLPPPQPVHVPYPLFTSAPIHPDARIVDAAPPPESYNMPYGAGSFVATVSPPVDSIQQYAAVAPPMTPVYGSDMAPNFANSINTAVNMSANASIPTYLPDPSSIMPMFGGSTVSYSSSSSCSRSRSRSRSRRRSKSKHSSSRHRSRHRRASSARSKSRHRRSSVGDSMVWVERDSSGRLVLHEDSGDEVKEKHSGTRIELDSKGRLRVSRPKK